MATFVFSGDAGFDMTGWGAAQIVDPISTAPASHTPTTVRYVTSAQVLVLTGTFTTFDASGNPTSGTINGFEHTLSQGIQRSVNVTGLNLAVTTFFDWIAAHDFAALALAFFGGNDQMTGTASSDTLSGYGGNDAITGGGGNDTLNGDDGDDFLDGGLGPDTLHGGAGNDVLQMSISPTLPTTTGEIFDGGDGIDTLRIVGSGISGFGVPGAAWFMGFATATLTSIERLQFAEGDKLLAEFNFGQLETQFSNALTIAGSSNDDTVRFVVNAPGTYSLANTTFTFENWDDGVNTGVIENFVRPTDTLLMSAINREGTALLAESVQFTGSSWRDTLRGGNAADVLNGGGGDDILVGFGGVDQMFGGSGDDVMVIFNTDNTALETYDGGEGDDFITAYGDVTFKGTLTSVEGFAFGLDVDSSITISWDTVRLMPAAVQVVGGDIKTTVNITVATASRVDLSQWRFASNYWSDTQDVIRVTGSSGNDIITGTSRADILNGADGDDTLNGGQGDDVLNGGAGADAMRGGAGNDAYVVDNAGDTITEAVNSGIDRVDASVSYALGVNVENLTLLGSADIDGRGNVLANTIIGNAGANRLYGGLGEDVLFGNDGNDRLDGASGNDTMSGGLGDDIYVVDAAGDVVSEQADEGIDRVDAYLSYTLGANLENLALQGTAALSGAGNDLANRIFGNTGNNTIFGDAGDDVLFGNDGNDRLDGGTGNDTMKGGLGDDVYIVDAAGDTATDEVNGGLDRVEAFVSYVLGANIEDLSLQGTAHINGSGNFLANTITGNSGNNNLYGGSGDDVLLGGDGNDRLNGATGNDTLTGGSGADKFVFTTMLADTGVDTITDFNAASDMIWLDDAVYTGISAGALDANAFTVGSAASDALDRLIYDPANGALYYDADGSGAGAAVQIATLSTGLELAASNFFGI